MKPFFQRFSRKGLICAHRGARSIAPENTFAAMDKAYGCGAELWETDVQMTSDQELVVFHDDTLLRTTDVSRHEEFQGRKEARLGSFSWPELSRLNAGEWFGRTDPFGTIKSGEVPAADLPVFAVQRIPKLDDVLLYCRQHDWPVNLEVKDQSGTVADALIVPKLIDLIRQTATQELVLISSFNHDYLRQIRDEFPQLATAALVERAHPDDLHAYLQELDCDAYHPDQRITDSALIGTLADVGIPVNVWTVNDVKRARSFLAAGAFFVCTDWPQRLIGRRHSA